MKLNRTIANIILLLITVAWGLGFVLGKVAIESNMSAALINVFRSFLFMFFTLIFFFPKIIKMNFHDFKIGLITGLFNCIGFLAQTEGVRYTTPSNNAFLTITYVLMVPFISWILYKKKPSIKVFIAIILCLYGMYWLTGINYDNYTFNKGDLLSIICAFFFALSLSILANSAKDSEFSVIAFMMGVVQTIGSFLYFAIVEGAPIDNIDWNAVILPILFLGIVGSFLAQSGQVIALKYTSDISAALILTLEGVFGAIFSIIWGYDVIDKSLVIGGLLIMASLIFYEIDFKFFNKFKT